MKQRIIIKKFGVEFRVIALMLAVLLVYLISSVGFIMVTNMDKSIGADGVCYMKSSDMSVYTVSQKVKDYFYLPDSKEGLTYKIGQAYNLIFKTYKTTRFLYKTKRKDYIPLGRTYRIRDMDFL